MSVITREEFSSIALVAKAEREKAKDRKNEKASESCHYFHKKMRKIEDFVDCGDEFYEVRGDEEGIYRKRL